LDLFLRFNSLILLTILLLGCSPINSVQPFDQQQAAQILKNDYVTQPAKQKIALDLPGDQKWKSLQTDANKNNRLLLPENNSLANWQQSIRTSITGYLDEPKINAKKIVLREIKNAYQQCQRVNASVLKETANYLIYKIDMAGCEHQPNQIQIGKTFNGSDAVYTVYYSAQTNQIATAQLILMSHVIKKSQLVAAS